MFESFFVLLFLAWIIQVVKASLAVEAPTQIKVKASYDALEKTPASLKAASLILSDAKTSQHSCKT